MTLTPNQPSGNQQKDGALLKNGTLIVATVFILLGVGNTLFGERKLRSYQPYLHASTEGATASPNGKSTSPAKSKRGTLGKNPLESLQSPEENLHERMFRIKIENRIQFYRLVVAGGGVFLLVGLFLFAVGFVQSLQNRIRGPITLPQNE